MNRVIRLLLAYPFHHEKHEDGGADEIDVTGLSGLLADPQITDTVRESSGPTNLPIGAIADGEFLKRSGASVVSGVPAGTYTDEQAQDAVGTVVAATPTVTLTYNDGAPSFSADLVTTIAAHKATGMVFSSSATYVDMGTGVAGTDNTAMTVLTRTLPANSLTQVGDRLRIRVYWTGDTGSPVTGTIKVGPAGAEVVASDTTDGGAASLQLGEAWLHYRDDTHANIIEQESGGLGAHSAVNVAGFDWDAAQNIIVTQNAIGNNHIIVHFVGVDIFPKAVE